MNDLGEEFHYLLVEEHTLIDLFNEIKKNGLISEENISPVAKKMENMINYFNKIREKGTEKALEIQKNKRN